MKLLIRQLLLWTLLLQVACGAADSNIPGAANTLLKRPARLQVEPQPVPPFADYRDTNEKKSAFFAYMNDKVRIANDEVWAERLFTLAALEKFMADTLHSEEILELAALADDYDLPLPETVSEEYFAELLSRIDVVPASLVLAQAANESGWGTSRFAVEGRNFFGIWCYQPGCGIPPARRDAESSHEVRKFSNVLEGVHFYIHNINMGHAYAELRAIRAEVRAEDEKPTGTVLAAGLLRYSERGEDYIDEIRAMIRQNNLASYSIRRKEG